MKYAVVTFGCRVNQADSLSLEAQLQARGLRHAAPDDADVVVVNTCSVTASADQGARQIIRRLGRDNPRARIVATGCYATRRPEEVSGLPNVVTVVTNDRKETLAAVVADALGMTSSERFAGGDGPCGAGPVPGTAGRTALTLRVQTGCDERCSYCIIPETRGPGRSRPLHEVVRELERAVAAGYKEIAVTGVHLGSYGRDLRDGTTLADLVRVLGEWPADVLFRLSSLEPMDCTNEIVDLVASSPRLAPHFHLPLQHGSDEMLSAMLRPYSAAYFAALVERIRRLLPDAAIGSDVVVGFPGESDRQFADLAGLLDALPLTHVHVFPYSDRPGTAASRMVPKVDGGVIRERARHARLAGARLAEAFRRTQTGRVRRALTVDDGWSAVTDNYLKVRLDRQHTRNEWVYAQV